MHSSHLLSTAVFAICLNVYVKLSKMPRGRKRTESTSRPGVRTRQSSNQVLTSNSRGNKRGADVLEDCVDPRVNQSDAGKSPIIDFEHIIQASNILPENSNSNSQIVGCGGVTLPNSTISSHLDNRSNNPTSVLNDLPVMAGIRLADDDLSAHVPATLKQKICKGEYINLALLLKGSVELSEFCKGSVFRLSSDGHLESAQRECKDQISSIEKWTNAFIIYASIYLSTHADKVYEILHYMFNIRDCAVRQGGLAWQAYDEQFRLRQAITPSPWCKINNDLWWRCVQVKPSLRTTINSYRYTCNDFNAGSCTWPNCKFSHTCATCSAPHSAINCYKGLQSKPVDQPATSADSSFRTKGGQPFVRGRARSRGQFRK